MWCEAMCSYRSGEGRPAEVCYANRRSDRSSGLHTVDWLGVILARNLAQDNLRRKVASASISKICRARLEQMASA